MKKLLFIILLASVCSCGPDDRFYNEVDARVVKREIRGNDKIWLIQLVNNPSMYAEICACNRHIPITDGKWHNVPIGGIVHYKYIGKYRFFTILPSQQLPTTKDTVITLKNRKYSY